jgi:hypothetical protein
MKSSCGLRGFIRSVLRSVVQILPTAVVARVLGGIVRLMWERAAQSDEETLRSMMDQFEGLAHDTGRRLRRADAAKQSLPPIRSWDGRESLQSLIASSQTPWADVSLPDVDIPGMITSEEARYYDFIGRFYAGCGEAVELGPWLGRSTYFILHGLSANPAFSGRRLWVFDDFVWRSEWMDQYVSADDRLPDRANFRPLFERHASRFLDRVTVTTRKIADYHGNEELPRLTWDGQPIEILYVDCGRTFEVNDAWFKILSPYFIAQRTLIVMQDWGTHAEIPMRWYNQTKHFTDSAGDHLQLVHELAHGSIATFLYRG